MADEPQPQSIAQRIAALKLNQVGRTPDQLSAVYKPATSGSTAGRPKPPPPPRPVVPVRPGLPARTQSSNVPPAQDHATILQNGISNLPEATGAAGDGSDGRLKPSLPPRTSTQSSGSPSLPPRRPSESPALPPRRPSESPALPPRRPSADPSIDSRRPSDYALSRKTSNESVSSVATARSGVSGISSGAGDRFAIKAPAYDPSSLPALPAKRSQEEKESEFKKYNAVNTNRPRGLKPTKSTPSIQPKQVGTTPPPPARPSFRQTPALPTRSHTIEEEPRRVEPPPRQRQIVAPPPRKSPLELGLNKATSSRSPLPDARTSSTPPSEIAAPPQVPAGFRPDLASLQASKPKLNGATNSTPAVGPPGSCLLCRDFSGPDNHAARFSRQSLASNDIGWLASQLTSPFSSATDQARSLFTWLHHNIEYNTVAFFNNNVKPSTPQSTLETGLAVCEGYASLFAAMAIKAGLEAYVISGHGKGFGHNALRPGDPIPPFNAGHAWNVVKLDGGEWKLIDCCWGAGAVAGKDQPYQKRFAPERFTQSNDEFGLDHYPGDSSKQFRNDGRVMSWEEYMLGNKNGSGASMFTGYVTEEGLAKTSFQPVANPILLSQLPAPSIRFSFQKICPHWDPVRCGNGPYFLYVLKLDGLDGTQRNHIPFETNGDVWWCDVPVRDLGGPGMKAHVYTVTEFDGADGRGLSIEKYFEKKGRCGMAFGGVCNWNVGA